MAALNGWPDNWQKWVTLNFLTLSATPSRLYGLAIQPPRDQGQIGLWLYFVMA